MDQYMGTITMFAFNWAPVNYAACAGQVVPISQNQALFSLLGTYFGGDGRTTYGLPDLRGRVPVGFGQSPGLPMRQIGEKFGLDSVALSQNNLAPHSHSIGEKQANQTAALHVKEDVANQPLPGGHYLAGGRSVDGSGVRVYSDSTPDATLASGAVTVDAGNLVVSDTGSGMPFEINQPSQVIGYAICTSGLYPSRS